MTNAFVSANNFNLSRLLGIPDDVVARLVPLVTTRANRTGVGKRAIIANPGCRLLFPESDGTFLSSEGHDRGDMSLLQLHIQEWRGQYAIEYRSLAFNLEVPVCIDQGENYQSLTQDKVTYTAHFTVSIASGGVENFLTSFGLSLTQKTITIQMISDALAKSIVAIAGNRVDEMGNIDPRCLYRIFNAVGLWIQNRPVIAHYANTRAKSFQKLIEDYEQRMSLELEEITKQKTEMIQQAQEASAQLLSELANAELETRDIDRITDKYNNGLRDALKEIDRVYAQSKQAWESRIQQAIGRAGISESNRPGRPQLPYSAGRNYLESGDRSYRSYTDQSWPQRYNDRQGYYGQRRDPYPRDQYSQYPREQYPPRSNNFRQPQSNYRPSDTPLAPYKHYQSDRYYTRQDSYRPDYQRPRQNNNNWNRPAAPAQNKFGPRQG